MVLDRGHQTPQSGRSEATSGPFEFRRSAFADVRAFVASHASNHDTLTGEETGERDRLLDALAEIERLKNYATHDPFCDAGGIDGPCTCGLSDLLEALRRA